MLGPRSRRAGVRRVGSRRWPRAAVRRSRPRTSLAITAPRRRSDPRLARAERPDGARARAAGLVPEPAEQLQYHVHAHLDVFVDGAHVTVPAGLGIDITNPGVHTVTSGGQTSYGGIVPPCDQPCISPLHTHDTTGIMHTESATRKDNTLGQFFVEWDVTSTRTASPRIASPPRPVAVYVNGTAFTGDPRDDPAQQPQGDRDRRSARRRPRSPSTADWNQILRGFPSAPRCATISCSPLRLERIDAPWLTPRSLQNAAPPPARARPAASAGRGSSPPWSTASAPTTCPSRCRSASSSTSSRAAAA